MGKPHLIGHAFSPTTQLELDTILVSAVLPDNHPHALKLPSRKLTPHPGILRSPGLGYKLRHSVSRLSLPSFRTNARMLRARKSKLSLEDMLADRGPFEGGYDSDAQSVVVRTPALSLRSSLKISAISTDQLGAAQDGVYEKPRCDFSTQREA